MIENNELVTIILVSYYSNKNLHKILKQIKKNTKSLLLKTHLFKSQKENRIRL